MHEQYAPRQHLGERLARRVRRPQIRPQPELKPSPVQPQKAPTTNVPPGRRYLTWYILFDDPQLSLRVAQLQDKLADLEYLDPVPADGLHLTVQGVGFADEVPAGEVAAIGAQARRLCADLEPFSLAIGPIAAYSGGTFLRASPWQPVIELRRRLRDAIANIRGVASVSAEPARFKPHVSVTYCHAEADATTLRQRLERLRSIKPISVRVDGVGLIALRREGRTYRWDIREQVRLRGACDNLDGRPEG